MNSNPGFRASQQVPEWHEANATPSAWYGLTRCPLCPAVSVRSEGGPLVDFAMSAFVTLLLVVDPIGLVPAFLSATHGLSERDRTTIAIRSPLIAAAILVALALCGNWLLRQLGIGIAAFQIAGGLLLFGVSYGMIFGDRPHREARETDKALSEHVADIAVFPLATPLMAGPARSQPRCYCPTPQRGCPGSSL